MVIVAGGALIVVIVVVRKLTARPRDPDAALRELLGPSGMAAMERNMAADQAKQDAIRREWRSRFEADVAAAGERDSIRKAGLEKLDLPPPVEESRMSLSLRESLPEPEIPLEDQEEALAKKIARLLLSASFHASRDPRAFEHLSTQLAGMGDSLRASGEVPWLRIKRRVEFLSGEHFVGIARYYDLLGSTPEAPRREPDPGALDALGNVAVEIAGQLGLQIVQWHNGILFVRDKDDLYSVKPPSDGAMPADLRTCLNPISTFRSGYIGEEHHSPREAATHAGLTVIKESSPGGAVVALDGFGRKVHVDATGNGPTAHASGGWASPEEMKKWVPQHRLPKRTTT